LDVPIGIGGAGGIRDLILAEGVRFGVAVVGVLFVEVAGDSACTDEPKTATRSAATIRIEKGFMIYRAPRTKNGKPGLPEKRQNRRRLVSSSKDDSIVKCPPLAR
jgi:hypothetical protein